MALHTAVEQELTRQERHLTVSTQLSPRSSRSSTCSTSEELPSPAAETDITASPEMTLHSLNRPKRRDNVYTFELNTPDDYEVGIDVGLGRHEPGTFSERVKGREEVYVRKENGVYFRVEALDQMSRDVGLKIGDELLAVNGFKLDVVSSLVAVE